MKSSIQIYTKQEYKLQSMRSMGGKEFTVLIAFCVVLLFLTIGSGNHRKLMEQFETVNIMGTQLSRFFFVNLDFPNVLPYQYIFG